MTIGTPTHINFILDETGSMGSVRDATISAFNEYVEGLQGEGNPITFTLTKFNSERVEIIEKGVGISDVAPLTRETYRPAAVTPLYDAIAGSIRSTERYLEGLDPKPSVVCDIFTDGFENASREYTREMIFDLITSKQAEGWTFAYMGANQDAWEIGESVGIPGKNTASYAQRNPGEAMNRKLTAMRRRVRRGTTIASEGFYTDEERQRGSSER